MAGTNDTQLLVPAFDVLVNGHRLTQTEKAYLIELEVDVSVALPSMFSFVMGTADTQQEDLPWLDEDMFAIGRSVEVKLGYEKDLVSVIKGETTAQEAEFSAMRGPALRVRGYDRRHRLMRGVQTRTFVKMKDSDMAQQIAGEVSLNPDVVDSKVVHEYLFQANQTNMDFLQERARSLHYELIVDDRTLRFRPVANKEHKTLTMKMGDDLLEFYPRLTSFQQVGSVTVRGWSPKEKKEIVGLAGGGDEESRMGGEQSDTSTTPTAFGQPPMMLADRPVLSQEEADQMAKSHYKKIGLSLIRGDGVCWGRTDLLPGTVITVEGVGKRFVGQYYLTSVVHRYSSQRGYHTHFEFQRNAS